LPGGDPAGARAPRSPLPVLDAEGATSRPGRWQRRGGSLSKNEVVTAQAMLREILPQEFPGVVPTPSLDGDPTDADPLPLAQALCGGIGDRVRGWARTRIYGLVLDLTYAGTPFTVTAAQRWMRLDSLAREIPAPPESLSRWSGGDEYTIEQVQSVTTRHQIA